MTERRLVAEPIRAWKHAGVVWSSQDPGPRFRPRSAGGTYGVDEVAECRPVDGVTPMWSRMRGESHEAPHTDCACGFYATKEPDHRLGTGQAALEVALSGTVIVHERGYRAQRQQVIGVRFPAVCGCGDTPVGLGQTPGWHSPHIAPVCLVCRGRDEPIQPADLAGALGVGVAYDDRWSVGAIGWNVTFTFHASTAAFSQAMTRAAASIGFTARDLAQAFNDLSNVAPRLNADLRSPAVIEAPDEPNAYPLERTPRHVLARQQGLRQVSRSRAPKAIDPRRIAP